MNRRLLAMAGVAPNEHSDSTADSFYADPGLRARLVRKLKRTGRLQSHLARMRRRDGSILLCLLQMEEIRAGGIRFILTAAQDVTEQTQTEERLAGVAALLKLFAEGQSLGDYLKSVVKLVRNWCGCECVGIRLPDGRGHLPYAAQVGFSREFLSRENNLCLSPTGCECMRALAAQVQPKVPAPLSQPSSYFCNQVSQYAQAAGSSRKERQRLACIAAGYESLAHAALRYQNQIVGTVHLADPSPGKFPAETVGFLESVSPLLAEAIHRFKLEESLHESEERFRSMFERHAAVMLLLDPDRGSIIEANPAAAAFYGYSQAALRRMNISDLNILPRATVARRRREAVREKTKFFTSPHRLASGEIRTVEVHSSPIEVKGKTLLFSIIQDITDRKLLEKEVLDVSERERQRVGRDLHDSLGSKLTGIALISKALARKLAISSHPDAGLADEVVRSINEATAQTRSLARGLCPAEFGSHGLAEALSGLARETQRCAGTICHLRLGSPVPLLDPFVATHLFRIAQEAVGNSVKHAAARNIWIALRRGKHELSLQIRDDGLGLPPDAAARNGLGLRTMKYRAAIMGGELSVTRGPAGGTIVCCRLPRPGSNHLKSK